VVVSLSPVLVSLGPFAVRWFGLLALGGLGLGVWLVVHEAQVKGIPTRLVFDALAWALPVGLVFARLIHVLGWWDAYVLQGGELVRFDLEDGLSLWGGLAAGGLVAAARLRHDPARRRRLLDAAAPATALGIAVGRLGAFLDGAGQGLPSDLPWATRYTSPLADVPDFGVGRHPAQVYDGLVCLALFALLRSPIALRLPAGGRAAVFFVLYGTARLLLEPLRLDPAFLFGTPIDALLAAGGVIVGLWSLLGSLRRRRAVRRARQADLQPRDSSSLAA
jgi:prolipoprotein diacylglyceryl transferase